MARLHGRWAAGALSVVAVAVAGLALVALWLRLFVGMDLQDESYYVLIPWRWALGDRPFVNEENLAQVPGLVMYPFFKVFGVVRGYDVTGLVLFSRHLYLAMMLGVAAAVFLLLRRLVRWQLALLVAALTLTFVFWATPQLSYNTIALAFLTLSLVLGAGTVLCDRGGRYAFASGAALGVAVVVYPTLLFIVPFWAVLLAFAFGRRSVAVIAEGQFMKPPDPAGPPTGPAAWRCLRAWVFGGLSVLLPVAAVVLSFGPRNLSRSLQWTMAGARVLDQVGGASKAIDVAAGTWRFMTGQPFVLIGALLVYLVYRRWPRLGRALLAVLPAVWWAAAQLPQIWAAGYVIVAAFSTPYLYLFLPSDRRECGAKVLIWIWAPSVIAGAMTAYTSANGYLSAAVGLAPVLVAAGLFLCWALEAAFVSSTSPRGARPGDRRVPGAGAWLAAIVLIAAVGASVSFLVQFQQRAVPPRELTARFDSGPWWGISVMPERRRLMDEFGADLACQSEPADQLLIFDRGAGYYLYWDGAIAANSYWLSLTVDGDLPQSTISYYRRHRVVPTLVVRLGSTVGMSDADLQAVTGGLDYPPTLVRPAYAFFRKPAEETTAEVLARLPRAESR